MKRFLSLALILAVLLACAGVTMAQQYQGQQYPAQQYAGQPYQGQQYPAQQYQGGTQPGGERTLNIPPAPAKTKPNMQYGNTARAAIIGERLSNAADGNANVYIKEDGAVTASIYLIQEADPYDIAGTMANLTYMMADLYGTMTEKSNSDIRVKVYDTANSQVIDAKFSIPKNAFAYFNVTAAQKQQPSRAGTGGYS